LLLFATVAVACGGKVGAPSVEADSAPPSPLDAEPVVDASPPPVFWDLSLDPSNSVLVVDRTPGASPATQTYKAVEHHDDGTKSDVTASSTFSLDDPTLGTFAGPVFTAAAPSGKDLGLSTFVHARHGAIKGLASLVLVMLFKDKDSYFIAPYMGEPSPTKQVMRATAGSTRLDLSLRLTDATSPSGSIKVGELVKAVRAMSEGDAGKGCAPRATKDADGDGVDETFVDVEPGASICFEVVAKMNTTLKPMDSTRFYAFKGALVGDPGTVEIEPHMLLFLVPPKILTTK